MKDFEYKDIKSVEDLFTNYTPERIRRALGYREAREIARIALNETFKRETDAIREVFNYFNSEDPVTPEPECNCPAATGRRWHTSPVTWAYSAYKEDIPNTARIIRENWEQIQTYCNIKLEETNQANCNICIRNGHLDGRGGTLGIAYVPAEGDRMSACGPTCGDIVIDEDEIWTPEFLKTVLLHEQLHAIGLSHSSNPESIMYPRYTGPKGIHSVDIPELQQRYPFPHV